MKGLVSFVGGALIGAAATALFTTPQGNDLRKRIKAILIEKGIIAEDNLDEVVDLIVAEVQENEK